MKVTIEIDEEVVDYFNNEYYPRMKDLGYEVTLTDFINTVVDVGLSEMIP